MSQENVKLFIPFKSLIESVSELNLDEKRRLWELLEKQIAQADEDLLEQDPKVRSEIEEARAAYKAKDYVTIDEYIASKRKKAR